MGSSQHACKPHRPGGEDGVGAGPVGEGVGLDVTPEVCDSGRMPAPQGKSR